MMTPLEKQLADALRKAQAALDLVAQPRSLQAEALADVDDALAAYDAPQATERAPAELLADYPLIFHFADDVCTEHARACYTRADVEAAVIWWLGEDASADSGERMAPGIADDLAAHGEWHAEDGSCYLVPMRRIVACVNACAGIPTEHLEGARLNPLLPGSRASFVLERDE